MQEEYHEAYLEVGELGRNDVNNIETEADATQDVNKISTFCSSDTAIGRSNNIGSTMATSKFPAAAVTESRKKKRQYKKKAQRRWKKFRRRCKPNTEDSDNDCSDSDTSTSIGTSSDDDALARIIPSVEKADFVAASPFAVAARHNGGTSTPNRSGSSLKSVADESGYRRGDEQDDEKKAKTNDNIFEEYIEEYEQVTNAASVDISSGRKCYVVRETHGGGWREFMWFGEKTCSLNLFLSRTEASDHAHALAIRWHNMSDYCDHGISGWDGDYIATQGDEEYENRESFTVHEVTVEGWRSDWTEEALMNHLWEQRWEEERQRDQPLTDQQLRARELERHSQFIAASEDGRVECLDPATKLVLSRYYHGVFSSSAEAAKKCSMAHQMGHRGEKLITNACNNGGDALFGFYFRYLGAPPPLQRNDIIEVYGILISKHDHDDLFPRMFADKEVAMKYIRTVLVPHFIFTKDGKINHEVSFTNCPFRVEEDESSIVLRKVKRVDSNVTSNLKEYECRRYNVGTFKIDPAQGQIDRQEISSDVQYRKQQKERRRRRMYHGDDDSYDY